MLSGRRKLYENRPPEEASRRLFRASYAQLGRQGRSEAVFGRLWGRSWDAFGALGAVLGPSGPLLGRPGPLLGASWGSFWDSQGADLDDLDDVCGAT